MPAVLTKQMALERAEEKIQQILIDLQNETGLEIHEVDVDTRQFAQMRTHIFSHDDQR